MTPQIVKDLLVKNTADNDLLKLIEVMVYDVKWKDFEPNSQNNYRFEFKTKIPYKDKESFKTHYIFRSKDKLNELIEIHYCLLMLEKRTNNLDCF